MSDGMFHAERPAIERLTRTDDALPPASPRMVGSIGTSVCRDAPQCGHHGPRGIPLQSPRHVHARQKPAVMELEFAHAQHAFPRSRWHLVSLAAGDQNRGFDRRYHHRLPPSWLAHASTTVMHCQGIAEANALIGRRRPALTDTRIRWRGLSSVAGVARRRSWHLPRRMRSGGCPGVKGPCPSAGLDESRASLETVRSAGKQGWCGPCGSCYCINTLIH